MFKDGMFTMEYGIFTGEDETNYFFQVIDSCTKEEKEEMLIGKSDMKYRPRFDIEGILQEGLGDLLIFISFPF